MTTPSPRPIPFQRRSSRMVGAFEPGSDIRDDISAAGSVHGDEVESQPILEHAFHDSNIQPRLDHAYDDSFVSEGQDSSSLLPPQIDHPSSLHEPSELSEQKSESRQEETHLPLANNTVVEEQEMNRRLADFESSFLPEPSTLTNASSDGERSAPVLQDIFDHSSSPREPSPSLRQRDIQRALTPESPTTRYTTPAPREYGQTLPEGIETPEIPNTSALERMSSSPTAARTVSRVQSMASIGGYETAAERDEPESPSLKRARSADPDATPRKSLGNASTKDGHSSSTLRINVFDQDGVPLNVTKRRPQYLSKRSSNARLSYDSMTSSADTEASEATVGADFALQSGGAAPESTRLRRKPHMTLSRSTSLGSLASGISTSDDEFQVTKQGNVAIAPELSTLQEESPLGSRPDPFSLSNAAVTPRASSHNLQMPTDSVIANHVRDINVPDTIARQFRSERNQSPNKNLSMAAMTPGPKRGLTLKEHRSTVEKLGKENFDLKMKIHFLDQALQKRSDDGIKEMITENVALKTKQLQMEKENHGLRKQVRELQRKLDEATGTPKESEDQGYGTDEERSPTIEEEVIYLRERLEINETEIEKLRTENISKESEKRRLAELVRNLGESRAGASEVGSREERDMWKDMLDAETIAREQAEDESRRLRDEVAKLREETFGSATRQSSKLKVVNGKVVPMSRSSSAEASKSAKLDMAELERLRHECSELQKTIGAQASALTSRNKEKEMLYQEIENLKLGRMGGLRSVAGDSILDRSASRARSHSRASNGTRYTRLSDNERDGLEGRIDELRDEVSQLKLDKQNLQAQLDEVMAELEAVDAQAQADADQFNEELAILTQERDNAMRDAEEQDQAFQQLKNEAQEEIDGLGDELDAKIEDCSRLEQELKAQADNVKALQSEMRSAAEGLVRLEEDAQQNLAQYQIVKAELDDANRELENMEKNLREAEAKVERLTVQQESSHNEIAFLREEQDADKIKIGDLESLLKKTHLNMDAERDRAKDLDRRLTDERTQRDAVANHEKQEVQRMMNELNREASASKDELRRLRKAMSQKDVEVNTFKDRLVQLEDNLRHIVNDPTATSGQLVSAVSRMQRDLEQANMDLDTTRGRLDEHKKLLADRDTLVENSALEARRLAELIERERQTHRQDTHSFEQALKSQQQASRMVSANNARITELEQARANYRKQLAQAESQYKDQLMERNQVLLSIWRKLSVMCGPDWAHNHSLINGNLPSQEVIGNILFWPGFSRNLLLAAKQVEGVLSGFKDKIKGVERDLWRNYNTLEKEFDARNKKLERIEEAWEKIKLREREIEAGLVSDNRSMRSATSRGSHKLKSENKLLKAELELLRHQIAKQATGQPQFGHHQQYHSAHEQSHNRTSSALSGAASQQDSTESGGIPGRGSSVRSKTRPSTSVANQAAALSRHHSTGGVDALDGRVSRSNSVVSGHSGRNSGFGFTINGPNPQNAPPSTTSGAGPISTQSKEDIRRSLIVPNLPLNTPLNGNFPMPPQIPTQNPNQMLDAGTSPLEKSKETEQSKWIHRLRELERRLKSEREQRLVDRSGMRQRLEERDAVNEELRRELERERLRSGSRAENEEALAKDWRGDHRVKPAYEEDIGTPTKQDFPENDVDDFLGSAEGQGSVGADVPVSVSDRGSGSPSKGSLRGGHPGLNGARGGVS